MAVKVRGQELIDRWIEPGPADLGPQEARLAGYGVTVWSLIAYLRIAGDDLARAASDYDLPLDAVRAAWAYYDVHQDLIDARIALNEAAFAG
jgi:uncharacterized protein (DUF433 family)